jgi:hypothetical protein
MTRSGFKSEPVQTVVVRYRPRPRIGSIADQVSPVMPYHNLTRMGWQYRTSCSMTVSTITIDAETGTGRMHCGFVLFSRRVYERAWIDTVFYAAASGAD